MEQQVGKNGPEKTKVKLSKDLKYGKVHLRQSLLDLTEFEDLSKLFKEKKEQYTIQEQDVTLATEKTEQNEEDDQVLLSPFERIEVYRKEKLNNKIKEKMNKMLDHVEVRKNRPRMPKTTKLLESFQEQYKKQMPISYKEDLRESEMNIEKIKMNNRRKFDVCRRGAKPLYQSRQQELKACKSFQEERARGRFISLKTSLPDREKHSYPSIRSMIQGKSRQNHHESVINVKHIDTMLDNFLSDNPKKIKVEQKRHSSLMSKVTNKPQSTLRPNPKALNVEKSFTRSEESSKQVLNTMASFYRTKHSKKHLYDEMVENLKYDRPLTSELRRKNYTVLGKDTLSPIQEYRELSEAQRKKIREDSIEFYSHLIDGLDAHHEQDIPTSIFIVEEVRRIFESEYIFTEEILRDLLAIVSKMDMDLKTEQVLDKIGQYVGFKIEVSLPQQQGCSVIE